MNPSGAEISRVDQPPIWVPVLQHGRGLMWYWPLSASQRSCPPPYCTQANSSAAVKPNGTAAKKSKAGDFFSQ